MRDEKEITAISEVFTRHWSVFGQYPGAELIEEDGTLRYRSAIHCIPYNAVIRTRIPEETDAERVIAHISKDFRDLALPFMWVVLPQDRPRNLEALLTTSGLERVDAVEGMSLDLAGWHSSPCPEGVTIQLAEQDEALEDYESLIRAYWSVPDRDRAALAAFNHTLCGPRSPGERLVAYSGGRPVGKLFLNLSGLPDAGIFGVAVLDEARKRGIGRALTEDAIDRARARGATRIVLHASAMARPLYERLGFLAHCTIPVYATEAIGGMLHH